MNLEAFVLGCGGMMPLPGRHLTSVLLRREGDLFLFDCGEGTQVSLRRLNLKWKKISVIFISHTHADHVTGLPGILMLSSQVDREEPLYIIGPPKTRSVVESFRSVLDMYINYEIIIREFTDPGIVFESDGYKVNAFQLQHSKTCFGYSLVEDDRPGIFNPEKAREFGVPEGPLWARLQAGENVENSDGKNVESSDVVGSRRSGRKFSYVTDTLYIDSIAKEVQDSDLLICEGMFTDELKESAREKKHLTAKQAGTIARDAGGIKSLGLIHYSPRYTEYDLKRLLAEARAIFSNTHLTKDRQITPIPFVD
ncbi:MAG: ribonuclease Z [Spirochaetales bacterium]|jgi:ribonuclease Z|nr:ribonuclease Z [Spirochaetales bacterium]